MRAVSLRTFALASLASLAMATSSSAVTILQFGQPSNQDFVTATVAAGVTTLVTNSQLAPGSIPVTITNLAGVTVNQPAFETFINVRSTGTATTANNSVQQLYSGTIAYTAGPNNTGGNFLTVTFQDALLSGNLGGGSASLVGSRPPGSVTFTSNFAAIVPLIAGNPPENFSISFQDIPSPGLTVAGGTIASNFRATTQGGFATGEVAPIPEPSGIVMAGTAMIACLGCIGWRRRQS